MTKGRMKNTAPLFKYDDEVEKQLNLLLGKLKGRGRSREASFDGFKDMSSQQKKLISERPKKPKTKIKKELRCMDPLPIDLYNPSLPKHTYASPYSKTNLGALAFESRSVEKKKKVKQLEERLPALFLKKPIVELKPIAPQYKIKWFAPDSNFKDRRIDIEVQSVLGKGAFATVYEANDHKLEKVVAVKIFDKRMLKDAGKRKDVQNELDLISKLDHSNIIKLLRIVEDTNQVYIVTENWGKYNMHEYIKDGKLHRHEIKSIFEQLVSAVAYLHTHNVFHRDIKLTNIMIKSGVICLLDFGLASNSHYSREFMYCGTAAYMAPEMYMRKGYEGASVDVWCIGVCIFKVLTEQFPFGGILRLIRS